MRRLDNECKTKCSAQSNRGARRNTCECQNLIYFYRKGTRVYSGPHICDRRFDFLDYNLHEDQRGIEFQKDLPQSAG